MRNSFLITVSLILISMFMIKNASAWTWGSPTDTEPARWLKKKAYDSVERKGWEVPKKVLKKFGWDEGRREDQERPLRTYDPDDPNVIIY